MHLCTGSHFRTLLTLFIFSLYLTYGGSCLFYRSLIPFPQDMIFLCGICAAALPCWEQDQATESRWTPAEVLTGSCLQCLDEGNHTGTSPGSDKKKQFVLQRETNKKNLSLHQILLKQRNIYNKHSSNVSV